MSTRRKRTGTGRMGERRHTSGQDHRGLRGEPNGGGDGLSLLQRRTDGRQQGKLLEPEVLVYATGDDGNLEVVAVEWVARGPNTLPPGPAEPPGVLGTPMHILVRGGLPHHARRDLEAEPGRDVADFNPDVTCP